MKEIIKNGIKEGLKEGLSLFKNFFCDIVLSFGWAAFAFIVFAICCIVSWNRVLSERVEEDRQELHDRSFVLIPNVGYYEESDKPYVAIPMNEVELKPTHGGACYVEYWRNGIKFQTFNFVLGEFPKDDKKQ